MIQNKLSAVQPLSYNWCIHCCRHDCLFQETPNQSKLVCITGMHRNINGQCLQRVCGPVPTTSSHFAPKMIPITGGPSWKDAKHLCGKGLRLRGGEPALAKRTFQVQSLALSVKYQIAGDVKDLCLGLWRAATSLCRQILTLDKWPNSAESSFMCSWNCKAKLLLHPLGSSNFKVAVRTDWYVTLSRAAYNGLPNSESSGGSQDNKHSWNEASMAEADV